MHITFDGPNQPNRACVALLFVLDSCLGTLNFLLRRIDILKWFYDALLYNRQLVVDCIALTGNSLAQQNFKVLGRK